MTPTESDEIERLKSELAEARNQRDHASVHLAHAIAELTQAEQAIDGIVTDAMAVKIFRRLLYKAISWIRDVWTMGRYRELKRSFEQLLINAKQSEERERDEARAGKLKAAEQERDKMTAHAAEIEQELAKTRINKVLEDDPEACAYDLNGTTVSAGVYYRQLWRDLKRENDGLRAELKTANEVIGRKGWSDHAAALHRAARAECKVAAANLENEELRKALTDIANECNRMTAHPWILIGAVIGIAKKALS